jgi:hypothetical protein
MGRFGMPELLIIVLIIIIIILIRGRRMPPYGWS